jgi:hypothetical protein
MPEHYLARHGEDEMTYMKVKTDLIFEKVVRFSKSFRTYFQTPPNKKRSFGEPFIMMLARYAGYRQVELILPTVLPNFSNNMCTTYPLFILWLNNSGS